MYFNKIHFVVPNRDPLKGQFVKKELKPSKTTQIFYKNPKEISKRIYYVPEFITRKLAPKNVERLLILFGFMPYDSEHMYQPYHYREKNYKFRVHNVLHHLLWETYHEKMKSFVEKYKLKHNNNNGYITLDTNQDFSGMYHTKEIPKRNGGTRELDIPNKDLKEIQRLYLQIISKVFNIIPHEAAHAFRPKRNIKTNAKKHRRSNYVIKNDIKDFFGSIQPDRFHRVIEKSLVYQPTLLKHTKHYIDDDYLEDNPDRFSELVRLAKLTQSFFQNIRRIGFYKNKLPQGSPLSPMLANIYMIPIDEMIEEELKKFSDNNLGCKVYYTRYSDDLTFSSGKHKLLSIIRTFGFPSNHKYILTYHISALLRRNNLILNEEKEKGFRIINNRAYVVGVKLNPKKQISYGHERKANIRRKIFKLIMAYKEENVPEDAKTIKGHISHAIHIDPSIKSILRKYLIKHNMSLNEFNKIA